MSKSGYSREGLSGKIVHYDENGQKIGESWPGFFGGYTNYDADGHKIGRSEEQIFTPGYTHYDENGRKTGRSDEGFFGGYHNFDAGGRPTGRSERSCFDIDEDSLRRTDSMYRKSWDSPGASSERKSASDRADISTGGAVLITLSSFILTVLIYMACGEKISGGLLAVIWFVLEILTGAVVYSMKKHR